MNEQTEKELSYASPIVPIAHELIGGAPAVINFKISESLDWIQRNMDPTAPRENYMHNLIRRLARTKFGNQYEDAVVGIATMISSDHDYIREWSEKERRFFLHTALNYKITDDQELLDSHHAHQLYFGGDELNSIQIRALKREIQQYKKMQQRLSERASPSRLER